MGNGALKLLKHDTEKNLYACASCGIIYFGEENAITCFNSHKLKK